MRACLGPQASKVRLQLSDGRLVGAAGRLPRCIHGQPLTTDRTREQPTRPSRLAPRQSRGAPTVQEHGGQRIEISAGCTQPGQAGQAVHGGSRGSQTGRIMGWEQPDPIRTALGRPPGHGVGLRRRVLAPMQTHLDIQAGPPHPSGFHQGLQCGIGRAGRCAEHRLLHSRYPTCNHEPNGLQSAIDEHLASGDIQPGPGHNEPCGAFQSMREPDEFLRERMVAPRPQLDGDRQRPSPVDSLDHQTPQRRRRKVRIRPRHREGQHQPSRRDAGWVPRGEAGPEATCGQPCPRDAVLERAHAATSLDRTRPAAGSVRWRDPALTGYPPPRASARGAALEHRMHRALSTIVLQVSLAAALGACDTAPAAQAERDYHAALRPILVDNAKMAKDFQSLAARIKKDAPDARDVGKRLDRQFIPGAQALADRAAAVQPGTQELADAHTLLVTAWEARVTHYEGIRDAWKDKDLDAYRAASDASYSSKALEDRYFRQVNIALAPAAVSLKPYP